MDMTVSDPADGSGDKFFRPARTSELASVAIDLPSILCLHANENAAAPGAHTENRIAASMSLRGRWTRDCYGRRIRIARKDAGHRSACRSPIFGVLPGTAERSACRAW